MWRLRRQAEEDSAEGFAWRNDLIVYPFLSKRRRALQVSLFTADLNGSECRQPPSQMLRILAELAVAALFVATAVSTAGWLRATRRLAESRREREDLANSSLVIEEERRVLELVAR